MIEHISTWFCPKCKYVGGKTYKVTVEEKITIIKGCMMCSESLEVNEKIAPTKPRTFFSRLKNFILKLMRTD